MLVDSILYIKVNDLFSFDSNMETFTISQRVPTDYTLLDETLTTFAFPDKDMTSNTKKIEYFTFVLTELDGKRRYCHCRREVHTTSHCLIIISVYKSFQLFYSLLNYLHLHI